MKQILLLMSLLFSLDASSQTTYYRYNDRTGTYDKAGYSEPGTPNKAYLSPYTSRVDLNLYRDVLKQKQSAYDANHNDVFHRLQSLNLSIRDLSELDQRRGTIVRIQFDEFINELNTHNYDYGNINTYNSILENIDIIQGNVTTLKQRVIKEMREK